MAALLGFSRLYLTSEVRFKSLDSTAVMVNTGFQSSWYHVLKFYLEVPLKDFLCNFLERPLF